MRVKQPTKSYQKSILFSDEFHVFPRPSFLLIFDRFWEALGAPKIEPFRPCRVFKKKGANSKAPLDAKRL